MNSSMINKIAKAKRYAEEPERIQLTRFEATFRGENDVHTMTYDNGEWNCTCRFFHDRGDCSHKMAMQRVLGVTILAAHRPGGGGGNGSGGSGDSEGGFPSFNSELMSSNRSMPTEEPKQHHEKD